LPRIRTIKPEFTQDEELSSLPAEVHLLAAGLLCHSDDEGYFKANPKLVKAAVFPLRETSLSIQEMLRELSNIGFIRLGETKDGKKIGHVVKFTEHQYVNRPSPSKIKPFISKWDHPCDTHPQFTEDSVGKGMERNGMERNGGKDAESKTLPPSEQVGNIRQAEEYPVHRLAQILLEKLNLTVTEKMLDMLTQQIQILSREKGVTSQQAANLLHDATVTAIKAGNRGTLFFFEDQKYRDFMSTTSVCNLHPDSRRTERGSCWQCYVDKDAETPHDQAACIQALDPLSH
jgi:hypothetical protein